MRRHRLFILITYIFYFCHAYASYDSRLSDDPYHKSPTWLYLIILIATKGTIHSPPDASRATATAKPTAPCSATPTSPPRSTSTSTTTWSKRNAASPRCSNPSANSRTPPT